MSKKTNSKKELRFKVAQSAQTFLFKSWKMGKNGLTIDFGKLRNQKKYALKIIFFHSEYIYSLNNQIIHTGCIKNNFADSRVEFLTLSKEKNRYKNMYAMPRFF